ncbi:hypothetical protein O181_071287 [Austropuccinia psidii MF-1]|uniref:Cytochrome b5 heme-binding domain-containing protein n=1 Tax=Austropuccinia psidii MF-1 TaxID=1389203 RepID=A0A9Q3F7G2_9BASI|nr:hypothetical protein [Austropuccinia psidii MF-1]
MFSYLQFFKKTQELNPSTGSLQSDNQAPTDHDLPPIFPAPNSIQRASAADQSIQPSFTFSAPDDDVSQDEDDQLPDFGDIDIDNLPPPTSTRSKPVVPRKKVKLQPGFSQLDWAKLKSSGANLRGPGVTSLRRITRTELSQHKTKDDAWSSFHGKVYNITSYLNFHPGGPRELMRVAGKDGTELFMKTHAWISVDSMLDTCMIGFLVDG